MKLKLFIGAAALVASHATAIEILPDSYSFDKATDIGTYNYSDWGGVQLIDGEYGVAPWTADLGNGNAYEWVGWSRDSPINIDFVFGGLQLINQIDIGTVQNHISDVVIPDADVYSSPDGTTWSLLGSIVTPESSANNDLYKTLSFTGLNITDNYVRVALSLNTNGPWTFTDEIDFFESVDVPDTGNTIAFLSIGILSLAFIRKRLHK